MDVPQTKRTLMNLPPKISVLLESNHGFGKSSIIKQVLAELSIRDKIPYWLVDLRLAQQELGDMIGMQRRVAKTEITRTMFVDGRFEYNKVEATNITVHDMAEWFPTDPNSHGILLLDELFRAQRDIQNAALQLVLDYEYHFKPLPEGWRVVAAANKNMDIYSGTPPCPALYSRFLKIDFKPTVKDWVDYSTKIGVLDYIIKYIMTLPENLGLDYTADQIKQGEAQPDPRSWEKLSDVIKYKDKHGDDVTKDPVYMTLLSTGYLGHEVATSFVEYVRKNFKTYNGEDILNRYNEEMHKEFQAMDVSEISFYEDRLVRHITQIKSLNKQQKLNLAKWFMIIPKESAVGFFIEFKAKNMDLSTDWYHNTPSPLPGMPTVEDYVLDLFFQDRALKGNKK
jgi:hypothetical protein